MTAREKQHNLKSFFKLADPRAVSVDEGKANQEGGGGGSPWASKDVGQVLVESLSSPPRNALSASKEIIVEN